MSTYQANPPNQSFSPSSPLAEQLGQLQTKFAQTQQGIDLMKALWKQSQASDNQLLNLMVQKSGSEQQAIRQSQKTRCSRDFQIKQQDNGLNNQQSANQSQSKQRQNKDQQGRIAQGYQILESGNIRIADYEHDEMLQGCGHVFQTAQQLAVHVKNAHKKKQSRQIDPGQKKSGKGVTKAISKKKQ